MECYLYCTTTMYGGIIQWMMAVQGRLQTKINISSNLYVIYNLLRSVANRRLVFWFNNNNDNLYQSPNWINFNQML